MGCLEDSCLDFRHDPKLTDEATWAPEGYTFYGGDLIATAPSALTQRDCFHLLKTHPIFTVKCPRCGHEFTETPQNHWDCPECQWKY